MIIAIGLMNLKYYLGEKSGPVKTVPTRPAPTPMCMSVGKGVFLIILIVHVSFVCVCMCHHLILQVLALQISFQWIEQNIKK